MKMPRFAIVGCGLIGKKRLASLAPGQLAVACDLDLGRAEALARTAGAEVRSTASFEEAVNDPAVEAVIVATLNGSLAPVSAAALRAGKHVLVEKPAGLNVGEIDGLIEAARQGGGGGCAWGTTTVFTRRWRRRGRW